MQTQVIGVLSDRTKRALAQRVALKAALESPMHDVEDGAVTARQAVPATLAAARRACPACRKIVESTPFEAWLAGGRKPLVCAEHRS